MTRVVFWPDNSIPIPLGIGGFLIKTSRKMFALPGCVFQLAGRVISRTRADSASERHSCRERNNPVFNELEIQRASGLWQL
jgi:hypothetical protein